MTQEKISIELTQEQFNHVKAILKQDKPSRTTLTREEKNHILWFMDIVDEDHSGHAYSDVMKSIRKKLVGS